jgi:hypothetical protein
MAQFEQALSAGLSALDDRINGRIKALEKRVDDLALKVGALEKPSAPAAAAGPSKSAGRPRGTTASAGAAQGKGEAKA